MGHKRGVQFRVFRSRVHPLRQVPATSRRGQQIFKVELQFEFGDAIFLFEFVHYIHFTVSRSGELIPRTTARTFHVATPLCLRRSYRRVPTCGVRISRLLPACVRRKQAQHPSCPCRTRGGVFGRCRCAPRPDPVGRGSRWLAKLTTACPPQDRARLPVRQQASPGGFDAFSL